MYGIRFLYRLCPLFIASKKMYIESDIYMGGIKMTNEEKYEVVMKWCSFCEDEGGIPKEELQVLWDLADTLLEQQ